MCPKKFMIIDGNSLINRAFYALPPLTTSKGIVTNAVYGFMNMLFKILDEQKPDYLAVAFDVSKKTFRNEQYAEYKAHRKAMPDDLRPQLPLLREVLEIMKVQCIGVEGFEADDVIGTLTRLAEEAGLENLIVTGDRDALQLVTDKTRTLITKKGISEYEIFDPAKVNEKYGVTPLQVIDLKGLMGDTSDNIPGIPGVGEKTAIKLIQEYQSVEAVLDHAEEIKGKLGERVRENKEMAVLSKQLATINREVPMDIGVNCCERQKPEYSKVIEKFSELEFKGLMKNLYNELAKETQAAQGEEASEKPQEESTVQVSYLHTKEEFLKLVEEIKTREHCAVLGLADNSRVMESKLEAIAIGFEQETSYIIDFNNSANEFTPDFGRSLLSELFTSNIAINTYDAKSLILQLRNLGITISNLQFDVMLAAYILNPAKGSEELREIAQEYLNLQLIGDGLTELGFGTSAILKLKEILDAKLQEDKLEALYYEVELPLVEVLAEMEWNGVKVDVEQLKEMSVLLGEGIERLTAEIYELAGETFNINSPKQLGVILFEKLMLPIIKKTKTGYSTDAEVLETLAQEHQAVEKILEYRQLVKLKSTYVDGLTALINSKTGKLHTTFNQTITATGRLSSTEPNLQNIPVRLELGRKIRKVFVPDNEEYLLLGADYSQIELRVLAHISKDETLIKAFEENLDIHTITASEVFGVSLEEVTSEMRRRAKAVNFGIVYGISDFGLGKDIKVTRKEAKQYIEKYFEKYPSVKGYMDEVIKSARDRGYVTTILNRRRYLPDLLSANRNVRNFGERTAMNTPIQGSAADIIKVAMNNVYHKLTEGGFQTKMLLQVHDELIFQVPKSEVERVVPLIKEEMEKAVPLAVPVEVDVKLGPNWYDLEKLG